MAKEIKYEACTTSVVWSSNGGSICTIDSDRRGQRIFTVHTYDVPSGTISSPGTLQSRLIPHLWTVDESFRVMTTVQNRYRIDIVDIFEVGSTLTKIQSFSPRLSKAMGSMSFSSTTHHISVSNLDTLSISYVRTSEVLLRTYGYFVSQSFSSDGSLFAAFKGRTLCLEV